MSKVQVDQPAQEALVVVLEQGVAVQVQGVAVQEQEVAVQEVQEVQEVQVCRLVPWGLGCP